MSSGGGKTQTTTSTSEPPAWAKPAYQWALGQAQQIAQQPYEAYQGNQVAGMTGDQNLAADLIRQQATNTGALDAAKGYIQSTLGGGNNFTAERNQFAGENPFLGQMIANAQKDVTDSFTSATLPSLMGQFSAGGAYGGSAHQQALQNSQKTLADQLGRVSTSLRSEDYNRQAGLDESFLQRQQAAAGMNNSLQQGALGALPGINQAGYLGGQMLGQQGAIQQATNQSQLDSDYNNYLDQRDWSANRLGILGNILGTVSGGSSSQTGANPNYRSAGQNALSTAAMVGGAMLMMSSKEVKDKQGELPPEKALEVIRSLPIDRWNYKGDSTPHIGTYAEDFNTSLGLPNRPYINAVDMFGALGGAVQALDKKISKGGKR